MNEDELVFYLDLTGLCLVKSGRCKNDRGNAGENNQYTCSKPIFHPVVFALTKLERQGQNNRFARRTPSSLQNRAIRTHRRSRQGDRSDKRLIHSTGAGVKKRSAFTPYKIDILQRETKLHMD